MRFPAPPTLLASLRRFAKAREAVSAVEFALILPVLVTLYLGTVEVTNAVSANQRVVSVASAIGDLAAQTATIDDGTMANIFAASAAIMQPFSTANLSMRVTQIAIDKNKKVTVSWSDAQNMSALTVGSNFTGLPTNIKTANTYLIYAEVNYNYQSPAGDFIKGILPMASSFYLRPRIGLCVQRNGAPNPC